MHNADDDSWQSKRLAWPMKKAGSGKARSGFVSAAAELPAT